GDPQLDGAGGGVGEVAGEAGDPGEVLLVAAVVARELGDERAGDGELAVVGGLADEQRAVGRSVVAGQQGELDLAARLRRPADDLVDLVLDDQGDVVLESELRLERGDAAGLEREAV